MNKLKIIAAFLVAAIAVHATPAPALEGKGAFVSIAPADVTGSRVSLRKSAVLSITVGPRKAVNGDDPGAIVIIVTSEIRDEGGSQRYMYMFDNVASALEFSEALLASLNG